ncbi:MAG: TonB-dependent receptor domain-containing protein [Candidatus Binatia bacterium]
MNERSFSGYARQRIFVTPRIRFEAGLRGDFYWFAADDRLPPQGEDPNFDPVPIGGSTTAGIVSPKANLVLTPTAETDVFLNFGSGFHSNDARNAVLARDDDEFSPLVRAIGWEVGSRTKGLGGLELAASFWFLDLDSELVFSGDAGNQETGAGGSVEPSGRTRRYGLDFEARYRITDWLFSDFDLSYARARFRNGDAIALAPWLLINGGLTAEFRGLSVALRSRFLADRPAAEDRSLVAEGYEIFDLIAKYRWRSVEASLALSNFTDTKWQEATFGETSCVLGEVGVAKGCAARPGKQTAHPEDPANDIHFTPGNPFGIRGGLAIFF